jgi:hypothetical protein
MKKTKLNEFIMQNELIDKDEKTLVMIVEYDALRKEIEWLIRDANNYQNFAIALIGSMVPVIAWIIEKAPIFLIPALLTMPFIFCLLGFLFFRQHEEVYIVASYLRDDLRKQIRTYLQDDTLWGWEEFKHDRSEQLYAKGVFKYLSSSRMVFTLRVFLFLLPSVFSMLLIILHTLSKGFITIIHQYSFNISLCLIFFFLFDIIIVSLLFIYTWKNGNHPARILGFNNKFNQKKKICN